MLSPDLSQARPRCHNFHLHRLALSPQDLATEILHGLQRPQKRLPAKLFYDTRGSQLFEAITQLAEYYPTRTEYSLLRRHLRQIKGLIGMTGVLVEPGSGSSDKARLLLSAKGLTAYIPIEISADFCIETALDLARDYPNLQVHALCADFTRLSSLPEELPGTPRTVFFPGSTIGNFEPPQAVKLLRRFHTWAGPGGGLLIGVDTRKDPAVLNLAYNDRQGVTAAFNLNILSHVNRLAGANFQLQHFCHQAFYNAPLGRIEMHLQSRCAHSVQVAGTTIQFQAGETIHTENSYKYLPDQFAELAQAAGFRQLYCWQDPPQYFSLHYYATD